MSDRNPLTTEDGRKKPGAGFRAVWAVIFLFASHPSSVGVVAADWKAEAPAGENVVETVSIQTSGRFTKVLIQSVRRLKYRDIGQELPPGIFLYMSEPTLSRRPPVEKTYDDLIEEVRFGYKGAKVPEDKPLPVEYVFLKLKEPANYIVTQKDWILVIELKPKGGRGPLASAPASRPYMPAVPSLAGSKPSAVLPANPTLQDFLDVGLANHVPLQLAEQDYQLSKLKYMEATRALFPSLTGRFEESRGTLLLDPTKPDDDTDFRRREVGLQIGQPLFQSGRLYYSLRQASVQKRISAQNLQKTRADITFEITRAYYNLIKAQRALTTRHGLVDRAQKVLDLTRKKRQLDLITEAEVLGVESLYSQIHYRMLSDEKDLELARLRMEALLNVSERLPETIPDMAGSLEGEGLLEVGVPVEILVDQALHARPEMLSAEYTAQFQEYGERIAKAEGRLRLDASGFVGKSGGAFDTQDLSLRSSWNVGLQASTFFSGSSLRGVGTAEKSSPDLGETSRTETRAQSLNVGFLDSLKSLSDRKQARISRERAFMEREQTRRNIEVEVREAYYNLQKAKLQLKGARQELNYREKEAAIARQKERLNLIDPSQSMGAENSLGEASVSYEEAAAFYRVSVASLEKAVGSPLDSVVVPR